ncbi:MAG: hypothetical protein R6V55_07970 [Desulfovermiculus sp.]
MVVKYCTYTMPSSISYAQQSSFARSGTDSFTGCTLQASQGCGR